ncbi:MAG TPA: hypothetical protein DGG95_15570 [Cytophagales bacterium]|nr:hypothetical protein [Cytophagales bacterium]
MFHLKKLPMKKLIVFCLLISAVSVGYAKSNMAVLRSGDVFKVIYKGESPSRVHVLISNETGEEVFREDLTSNAGFIRPYNFSGLPNGNYSISVKDSDGEKIETVGYNEEKKVRSIDDNEWIAYIAQLSASENKFLVAVPKQGESNFSIQIFDPADQLVYSDEQKTNTHFGKIFKLKNCESGTTIRVTNHKTGETKAVKLN